MEVGSSEDSEYIAGICSQLKIWILKERGNGRDSFKLSETKEAFPTINQVWLEKACEELIRTGHLISENLSRIKIYSIVLDKFPILQKMPTHQNFDECDQHSEKRPNVKKVRPAESSIESPSSSCADSGVTHDDEIPEWEFKYVPVNEGIVSKVGMDTLAIVYKIFNEAFLESDGCANRVEILSAAERMGCSIEDFNAAAAHMVDQNKIMIDGDDIYQI